MTAREIEPGASCTANLQDATVLRRLEAETAGLMIRYRHKMAKLRYHEAKRLAEEAERHRRWWRQPSDLDAVLFGIACSGAVIWAIA